LRKDYRGYNAGKKINGRKRFITTDTLGLLLAGLAGPVVLVVFVVICRVDPRLPRST
jgi:hypothetical protein